MAKTVDFSQARFKHLNWKFRLRNFLDGKETLTVDQAVSHRHCDLGKWFYEEGKSKYGHLTSIKDFEIEHELLHNAVKDIQRLKTNGDTLEAEKRYLDLVKISDKIILLLSLAEVDINDTE